MSVQSELPYLEPASAIHLSGSQSNLAYTAGTLDVADQYQFQRMIFRASRGKALINFSQQSFEISQAEKKPIQKIVYVVVYERDFAQDRIQKVCISFMGKIYNLPEDHEAYKRLEHEVNAQLVKTMSLVKISRE